jgi:hypothetical protein
MTVVSDEHHGVDAWIFLSIADTHGRPAEYSDPLATVMSNADWRNRGVPSAAEFEHAVRDLSGAGLIRADGVQFSLTDSGQALWRKTQGQGQGAHSQFVYARDQMETVPCVSSSGGWSLDQGRWEDHLRTTPRSSRWSGSAAMP